MSQCICTICSNKGPEIVYPILPKQLFGKYIQQVGVNNKAGFITSSFREYVHFRCAFFVPHLRWLKEVFNRSHLDYVCFGLEWILSLKNREDLCAVCQNCYKSKVLLNCAGKSNGPCNKRYHADCVIAVRKRIYYKPGKVTLLCNEHFSEGKLDPQNKLLDWMEFDIIVQKHVESNTLSQEQEKQSYILSANPRPPDSFPLSHLHTVKPKTQLLKTQLNKQRINTPNKEEEDAKDSLQYLFRPKEIFQIDYSNRNAQKLAVPVRKHRHNGNVSQRQGEIIENNSYSDSSFPLEQNKKTNHSDQMIISEIKYSANDSNQKEVPLKITSKEVGKPPGPSRVDEEEKHMQVSSASIKQPSTFRGFGRITQNRQPERIQERRPISMLEDNEEESQPFNQYETKKSNPLNNQFKQQMFLDTLDEEQMKPQLQLQQLEKIKQIRDRQFKRSVMSVSQADTQEAPKLSESQNKIKQLQKDLEEAHNEIDSRYLTGRQLKQIQSQQSTITPKVRFKRQPMNQIEDDETTQSVPQKKTILPKTNYKIEVLSQLIPIYPYEEEEKRWESMTAWWSKIDEFFFQNKEIQADLRDQKATEITIQPTVELLKKTYLSVLFQARQHNLIVHYELDLKPQEGLNGAVKQAENQIKTINLFDRRMNQVLLIGGNKEICGLKYVEALQLSDQEAKDSIKLHQSIVNSQQNSELDIMYSHLLKEFEELEDSNSAYLRQLQMKMSQPQNQIGDLFSIIQESVSMVDQLRWNEIIRCFQLGFMNKTNAVLESFNLPLTEEYQKLLVIYGQEPTSQIQTDCQVCFAGLVMSLNPIVYCEICATSFHQYCYGIPEDDLINSNTFKCDKCKNQNKKHCYICKKRHSPLPLKLFQNNYFHPSCIVLFEYLSIRRPLQIAKGVSLGSMEASINQTIECCICQKKKGRKIKCRECDKQCHILCAYLNGFEVLIEIDQNKKNKITVELVCGAHAVGLSWLIDQIFYRRFSINYDEAANYESSQSYFEEKLKEDIEFKQVKKLLENYSAEAPIIKKVKMTSSD